MEEIEYVINAVLRVYDSNEILAKAAISKIKK